MSTPFNTITATTLTRAFLKSHSTWSIEELYNYCIKYYGISHDLFQTLVREYIDTLQVHIITGTGTGEITYAHNP